MFPILNFIVNLFSFLQLLCRPNFIKLDLSMFRVSLSAFNQLSIFFNESFRSFFRILISLLERNRHLSSANRTSFTFGDEICKSFTYNRKNRGPKNTVLFLLLVSCVRDKIETILEQYLAHHNNPTYIIKFHGLLCQRLLRSLEK